jgi:hypothetical protein
LSHVTRLFFLAVTQHNVLRFIHILECILNLLLDSIPRCGHTCEICIALYMLGKCSSIELHPQPSDTYFLVFIYDSWLIISVPRLLWPTFVQQ